MSGSDHPAHLQAEYFDGRSARAHAVRLCLHDDVLHITGETLVLRLPARQVEWPERTRHGPRVANLPGGGSLHCGDADAWDGWVRASGRSESLVVRAQQSWRWVAASVVALVLAAAGLYVWGVPWLARVTVAAIPQSVDRAIGESALNALDGELLRPSALPLEQRQRLSQAFDSAVATLPADAAPPYRLVFRSGRLGPNAFALPGGTLVMTDALVRLVDGDEAMIIGVLGHELGHVTERHGLRLLVQAGVIGALSSVVLGDFSTLLAGAPALLGQASYSRDAEREADVHAVTLLKAAGLSPAVMAGFFEKIARRAGTTGKSGQDSAGAASGFGIAISSHPADEERIRYFREAANR